ncbi:MAG: alpha/beta hydrolase, partial [Candidatus Acidiferrales bacterium]
IYQRHFVTGLKRRMRYKSSLFPGRFPIDGMRSIRTIREWDERITARFCGFTGADYYYSRSSAGRVIAQIRKPTLILTAQDDPFVPFASFANPAIAANPSITLVAPAHGGHCAFISNEPGDARFWAESRVVDFCAQHSTLSR